MDVVKQKLGAEHKEELAGGKVLLFSRNGIFQARLYKGDRAYVYKSLKTRKLEVARDLALRFLHETEYKQSEGLPIQQKTFGDVLREYIAHRQKQYDQSQVATANASRRGQVSIHMLRQIRRVSRFLFEYCGNKAVDKIDNAVLADYVPWRKDYALHFKKEYGNVSKEDYVQWFLTFAKEINRASRGACLCSCAAQDRYRRAWRAPQH